jgi:two-component system response regulator YesN
LKLLIVEDEILTREGLMQSLSWPEFGITSVLCAENGKVGLSMAKKEMPDIVITDIRMPRMDGITMAYRIRERLPDCRIIFLSAYSEIDYYKAALDLKAVRYLDKPIEMAQLESVIRQAVAECVEIRRHKFNFEFQKMNEKQRLADAICSGESAAVLENEFKRLHPSEAQKCDEMITAFLINLRLKDEEDWGKKQAELAAALGEAGSQLILSTIRHKNRIVLFLFTPAEPSSFARNLVCEKLKHLLHGYVFYITVGKTMRGIGSANKSYDAAKEAMNKAYCFPFGQVIFYSEAIEKKDVCLSAYADVKSAILDELAGKNKEAALTAADVLYQKLKDKKDLTCQKAQELYCEIISEVFLLADSLHLRIKEESTGEEIAWVARIESFNLDELHGFLCRQIGLLFDALEETKNETLHIQAIKEYIAQHYMDDTLSVSDISTFLNMSASYVCTVFKRETGVTINGYLTEYRLEKAKKYLDGTLFSVSEISTKIGYKDNSYFGRIFRKQFGLTPNEYRNRLRK